MERRVYGLVLAGGRSLRMGRDKTFVECGGRSLLSRVEERLRPQCKALVLSRAGEPGGLDPDAEGLAVVGDDLAGGLGPLAGIAAGLAWIARADPAVGDAVVTAVDTPFLPLDLVRRLSAARDRDRSVLACAASGGRRHPVVALWPVDLHHALRSALVDEGLRKVGAFLDRYAVAVADWPTDPYDPFLNLNTMADLAAAEDIVARIPGL